MFTNKKYATNLVNYAPIELRYAVVAHFRFYVLAFLIRENCYCYYRTRIHLTSVRPDVSFHKLI